MYYPTSTTVIFLVLFNFVTCHPVSEPAYQNNQYTQVIPTIQYKPQQRPVYENRPQGLQYYQSKNAIQTQAQPVHSLVLPAQVAPGHKSGIQTQGHAVQTQVFPAQVAPGHVQPQQQRTSIQTQSEPIHELLLGARINPNLLRPQPEPEKHPQNPAPAFYEQVLKAQQAAQARQSAQQVQQQIDAAQKYKAEQAKARAQAESQQPKQPLFYQHNQQPQPQAVRYAQPQQVQYATRPIEQPARQQEQQLYSARIPQQQAVENEDEGDFDHNPSYQFGFDVKDDQFTNYQQRKEQRDGNVIKGSYSVVDADGYIRTVQYTADPKEGFKAEVTREPTNIQIIQPKPEQQYAQQPQPQAQAYKPQYIRPQQRSAQDEGESNVVYRYQQ